MTFGSLTLPPGWMAAVAPASAAAMRPSGKGKKASEATMLPLRLELRLGGFPDRDAGGIDARHLARADAERAVARGVDDGVGLHVLDHAPAEEERLAFGVGGRALGDDFPVGGGDGVGIAALEEERVAHGGADFEAGRGRGRSRC